MAENTTERTLPPYRPAECPIDEQRRAGGYMAWCGKSDAWEARGVEQQLCARCGCYLWPDEQCEEFIRSDVQ